MNEQLSIVVPIFNEEGNVSELHREIKEICTRENYIYEIIFIDDGSTDRSIEEMSTLSPIKIIQLRKNFGQTAAMDAGIKAAKYHLIITMDGDRQNDPSDIPLLIKKLRKENFDVISGWRKKRKDPIMKRFVSRGANLLRSLFIHDGIHDSGCSLKVYKKECFESLSLYGEMHRFIPALLKIKGFVIGEEIVNHRPRVEGVTKYNWKRSIKGFLDMLSVWFWHKYAVRPLHLLGGLGLFAVLLGFIITVIGIIFYITGNLLFRNVLPVFAALLFITGLQLFISGLVADILIKNYFSSTEDAPYLIKGIVEY